MRSIKFRAWDTAAKQMLTNTSLSVRFDGEVVHAVDTDNAWKHVDLMQFAGLYDKNGKEIYEGDVVQFYMDGVGKGEGLQMRVVKWSPTITGFDPFNDYSQHCCNWSVDMKTVEIIGNIYENPALVETCNEFN